MVMHDSTEYFPEYLQNELTPGVVALMRAWLAEACRINGTDWSAYGLMDSLAAYVIEGMEEKDLGLTPRNRPTMEELATGLEACK